jgi:hypothetical protein
MPMPAPRQPDPTKTQEEVLRERAEERQRKVDEGEVDKAVDKNTDLMGKGKVKIKDPADAAFIDTTTEEGQRNFRRASDPDKKLGAATIDEARAMDHAEKAGIFGPGVRVDRSGRPGADVVTRGPTGEEHWSMKAIRTDTPDAANSRDRVKKEITSAADALASGKEAIGVLVDLRVLAAAAKTDPKAAAELAKIKAEVQAQAATASAGLKSGVKLKFIE